VNAKEQKDSNPMSKKAPVGCLVMVLVCITPFVLIFAALRKAYLDAEHARKEIERTVNPDQLRAWVLEELRKQPQGGEGFRSQDDLPATFPHFPANYFYVFLYPLDDADGWGGANLAWSFKDQSLSVRVWLNADGTPANLKDEPQQWAEGIVISSYSK
jgi:hypothetical protein